MSMDALDNLEHRIARLEARNEIISTIHNYCLRLDKRDLEGVLELFTDDYKFAFPGWQLYIDGKEEIRKYFAEQLFATHEYNNHKVSNLEVALNGDQADCEAYLLLHSSCMGEEQEAVIRYQIKVRRVAGSWKLADISCAVVNWKGSLAPKDKGIYERFDSKR